jgi:hypothetical protein
MEIQKKEAYTLVKIESSLEAFKAQWKDFQSNHLIVEVSENLNINESEISLLLEISTTFKQNGMSFVVVKSGIDIDNFPETLNIVPTLQEAEDVLEMEAIERDLGF